MSNSVAIRPSLGVAPTLPDVFRTRNGAMICPNQDQWAYRDSSATVYLDFTSLHATPDLVVSAKRTLVWYAENRSPYHLSNMFFYLAFFFRQRAESTGLPVSMITPESILSYRSCLRNRDSYYLGSLSGFLPEMAFAEPLWRNR